MADIFIRELATLEAYRQLDRVQLTAWDRDERSIVPWEFMKAAQYNGAALIGAFEGTPDERESRLVGYVFGILGTVPSLDTRRDPVAAARLQMYSHQLAVLPDFRGRQIGRRLKLAQRAFCQRIGVRQITWTFDPLISRNAWLNIGRLGGISNTFLPAWYGAGRDRIYLEWWITSNRVNRRIEGDRRPLKLAAMLGGGALIANPAMINGAGFPVPPAEFELVDNYTALLEIPADMETIEKEDEPLATRWRSHARSLFTTYFNAGFIITDIAHQEDEAGHARSFYLATHHDAGRVLDLIN